ncbi:MAG: M67 family metallopeptidase, partial [Thermomicrobiaceae bacterium]|nr:M67 family metallopeptidase [Thermomicrobiaceae bacterium]
MTIFRQSPPATLQIPADLYAAMIAHVRAALPCEGCGLLAVDGERAVQIFPGTNTARSATRYNMDPEEVVRAFDEMQRRGWQLGAIFHSHPDTPARPSLTDLRHAYYPEALMVIVSFQTDPPT